MKIDFVLEMQSTFGRQLKSAIQNAQNTVIGVDFLYYSDMELVIAYRQAKRKDRQVNILAELNCCSKEKIMDILTRYGIEIKEKSKSYL